MSEKMDGVRAYWDGEKLVSRHGKSLQHPQHFTWDLPKISLDGELWMGRGTFENLIRLLMQANVTNPLHGDTNKLEWSQVGYYLFDLPASESPYKERLKELQEMRFPSHVHIVSSEECRDKEHMEALLHEIVRGKGEGLMVRHPLSKHTAGVTSDILKVKVSIYQSLFSNTSELSQDTEVEILEVGPTGLYCQQ